ncbi:MAG: hypothetical protein J2P47_06360, partial [Acetobacteraceae bacterium]|nr:hypothetical protein [Acetobacteraceae bacterium]
MLSGTLSSRVAMPPSNLGGGASRATAWHWFGSTTWATDLGDALIEQFLEDASAIVGCATDDEIVDRGTPMFAHPLEIGLESAGAGDH